MRQRRREFLKVREAAEILGISKASVYEMIRQNMLKVHRFSQRRMRIHTDDLQQFIDKAKANVVR